MNSHPSFFPDTGNGPSSRDETGSNGSDKPFALDPRDQIEEVTKTLAQAGGGELSADLALDLVMNEIVEEARDVTRAIGAAIALERDGEMVCRATTGNAPHLGARVAASALSAACLAREEVQRCADTEVDPRVDAESCRRLGFRSMLMAPIANRQGAFGILEIFADQPNAFTEKDVKTLQRLALRIVQSSPTSPPDSAVPTFSSPSPLGTAAAEHVDSVSERLRSLTDPIQSLQPDTDALTAAEPKKNDVLTSILVVLVITAATVLGVVIGVRYTMNDVRSNNPAQGAVKASPPGSAQPAAKKQRAPVNSAAPSKASNPAKEIEPPSGGLIVTENGKVIYRVDPPAATNGASTEPADASSRIIHRVEPQYPEAAKSQRIQGPVVLDAQVLGDGSVGNVSIVEGNALLAEAAAEAVKQWKYQPFYVDGRPVARQERITVKFKLPTS